MYDLVADPALLVVTHTCCRRDMCFCWPAGLVRLAGSCRRNLQDHITCLYLAFLCNLQELHRV